MSTSNNTHANSVASSATSASSNRHPSSTTRRSSVSVAGTGGGSGGGKSSSGGGGASSGSTITTTTTTNPTPACAACKYQRRKCNPDCILGPYFPADHQLQFLNAHRLFGVSNIIKTLRSLDPSQRAAAMGSIIFQSDARARDPVGGCYRIILELQRQIDRDSAELDLVLRQLAICRAQAQQLPPAPPVLPPELNISATINLIDQADDTSPEDDIIGIPTLQHEQQAQEQQDQQKQQERQFLYYYFGGGDDDQSHGNPDNVAGGMTIKDVLFRGSSMEPPPASPLLGHQFHHQSCDDDDDGSIVKPTPVEALLDVAGNPHSFLLAGDEDVDSQDVYPDSDYRANGSAGGRRVEAKEDMANAMEQASMQENDDLKNAASLFKLTADCDLSGGDS